jgi:hypothetical protein
MNKIVREHYPAARLPDDLREGIDSDGEVRITIEQVGPSQKESMSLEEIFAVATPPYRTKEEIDDEIRQLREEWSDRA